MSNELLEELRRFRREMSEETGGTLEGLFAHLKQREKVTTARLVDRSKMQASKLLVQPADKVAESGAEYPEK